VVATLIAIVLSPIFGHYETIFQGLNKLICYLSPPITAVFLVGVFWKRAGARAAYITMISGIVMGLVCFVFDFFKSSIVGADATPATIAASPFLNLVYNFMLADWMLTSFVACALCVGIHIVCSFVIPEPLKEEARTLVWENWLEPIRAKCGSGLSDYRVMSAVVVITFVVLYYFFF